MVFSKTELEEGEDMELGTSVVRRSFEKVPCPSRQDLEEAALALINENKRTADLDHSLICSGCEMILSGHLERLHPDGYEKLKNTFQIWKTLEKGQVGELD